MRHVSRKMLCYYLKYLFHFSCKRSFECFIVISQKKFFSTLKLYLVLLLFGVFFSNQITEWWFLFLIFYADYLEGLPHLHADLKTTSTNINLRADFGDLRGFIYMIDIDFAVYYSLFIQFLKTWMYQGLSNSSWTGKTVKICRSINPADFYFDNRHTYKFNKYFNFSSYRINMNFYWIKCKGIAALGAALQSLIDVHNVTDVL